MRGITLTILNIAHKRTLKVIYDDQYNSFARLLRIKDNPIITPCLNNPLGKISNFFRGETLEKIFHRGDTETRQVWYENLARWTDKYFALTQKYMHLIDQEIHKWLHEIQVQKNLMSYCISYQRILKCWEQIWIHELSDE